jgi:hypothetical protein
MSLIVSLKAWIEKEEARLGIVGAKLLGDISVAETIAVNLKAILQNPTVDSFLAALTKGVSTTLLPKVEAFLTTLVADLTIGSAIEADVKAAPDLESKLKIFITDLSKYGITTKDMFIQKICSLILAALDDNTLTQSLYDLYSQASYTLANK